MTTLNVQKPPMAHQFEDDENRPNRLLLRSSGNGQIAKVKEAFEKGASPNTMDMNGYTPLHNASRTGSPELVELLVKKGASLDSKNEEYGMAPLHEAVYYNQLQVVSTLIKHGADLEARDKDGNTPFQWACCFNNLYLVHKLLELGAKIDTVNDKGDSPLDIADRMGHDQVIKLLCERNGHNYMMEALKKDDLMRVTALIYAGVVPKPEYGLHAKTEEIVQLLLRHADPKDLYKA